MRVADYFVSRWPVQTGRCFLDAFTCVHFFVVFHLPLLANSKYEIFNLPESFMLSFFLFKNVSLQEIKSYYSYKALLMSLNSFRIFFSSSSVFEEFLNEMCTLLLLPTIIFICLSFFLILVWAESMDIFLVIVKEPLEHFRFHWQVFVVNKFYSRKKYKTTYAGCF